MSSAPSSPDNPVAAPLPQKHLKNSLAFLRDTKKSELRIREGVLNGNRVNYFKGKHAVAALSSETAPKVNDSSSPTETLTALLDSNQIIRVSKPPKSKYLSLSPLQSFEPSDYYAIVTPPSPMTYIYSILLVVIVLAGVMFPLWPDSLRQGVWYLSMGSLGLLGLLMVIAVVRLIVFLLTVVVGKGIWIFPNLFADVGIIDSFKPAWEWHVTEKQLKEKKSPKGKAKKTKSSEEE